MSGCHHPIGRFEEAIEKEFQRVMEKTIKFETNERVKHFKSLKHKDRMKYIDFLHVNLSASEFSRFCEACDEVFGEEKGPM